MKKGLFKRGSALVVSAAAFLMGVLGDGGIANTLSETATADTSVIAFPGAVGAGQYATGGRGGEVVHVTNLNDSGEGSLREAVSQSNRIVVFDVSGTIELKSNIVVASNVTIAGQTAPGGSGVTLKNYKLGLGGDNIIVRYISSRPGPYCSTSSGNDALGGSAGSNSIIDHCSFSWASDEQWGLYSNNEYYTVQYCVIGPADSWGGHSKGVHGFGIMMGKGYFTFDHNLIAHCVSRNFRGKVQGTETADFTNNVIYNWAYQTAYGTIGHLNYVGNTLKMGNGTVGGYRYVAVDSSTKAQNFWIYLCDNRMLYSDDSVYASITDDNWAGITYSATYTDSDGNTVAKDESNTRSDTAFETIVNGVNVSTALTAESAEDAYEHVITYAGNGISPTLRTAVDQQVAYETLTGTGNLSGTAEYDDATDAQKTTIDTYSIECGVEYEYPEAILENDIVDSDNDGMPDDWELARGLDPNDPSDTNGDYCGQGYTNIEYYINDLTIDSFPEGTVTLSPETCEVDKGNNMDTSVSYVFKNLGSGKYISVEDSLASAGANVIQASSYSIDASIWSLEYAGDGYYYIISHLGDGKTYYLDLDYGLTADGTNIGIYTDTQSDAQLFQFIENDDGSYTIVTKATEGASCLAVQGNSDEAGANILQWEISNTDYQKWWCVTTTVKVASSVDTGYTYMIKNVNSGLYMEIESATQEDGTNVQQWGASGSSSHNTWYLKSAGSGYYYIVSTLGDGSTWYLNITDGSSKSGANAEITSEVSSSAQLFKFVENEDGTYTIYTKSSKDACALEIASSSTSSGANVQQATDSGASNQQWILEAVAAISDATLLGDVNCDNSVTVLDVVALTKYLLGRNTLDDTARKQADMNEDNFITVYDLTLLKKVLV